MKQPPDLHIFQTPHPTPRTIRVLLPPNYHSSAHCYPVIYALDGQNLFEAETAYGGRHWKIPYTMSKLPKRLQAIVVGIDNAGADRIREYAPYQRGKQGGGGLAHLHFIIQTLKPEVDASFRTLPQADSTAIVGSSMGGLLAFYAGLRFGDVFGKVGALSPSLWFNPHVLQLAANDVGKKSRFYVAGSRTESRRMELGLQNVYRALRKGGFSDEGIRVVIRDRGKHNEVFWGREFPKMWRWLASK